MPRNLNTAGSRTWLIVGVMLSPLLLSGCGVSQSDYDVLEAQNQQLQSQSQQLESQSRLLQSQNQLLQWQNGQLQAQVDQLQHAIAYTINSDLLFRPGSWGMTDQGRDIIGKLSHKLMPTQQNKLLVNGYTDNAPISPRLTRQGVTSNLELSQRRADTVMQFLISQGMDQDMVTAQGLGDSDPVASNDTPQGRAQNRRVVLSVGGEAVQGSSIPH
jgi:chemotaxis protein MotB